MSTQNKGESAQQQLTASSLTIGAPVLGAPKLQLNFDPDRPEGAYQVDAFFLNFFPNTLSRNSEDDRRPHFELFRYDVGRLVKVARLRAQREDEIEPTRREANELLEILADLHPALVRLSHLGRPGESTELVVRLATVLQPREAEPTTNIIAILTQLLDALRAPRRHEDSGEEGSILQWLRELDHYEIAPRLPPRREPLARHFTEQAIALHARRLGVRPPASRGYWLGQFLAALWQDLQQPIPDKVDDLDYYFGKKIEDAVRGM